MVMRVVAELQCAGKEASAGSAGGGRVCQRPAKEKTDSWRRGV